MRRLIPGFTHRVIDTRQVSAETQCVPNSLPPSKLCLFGPVVEDRSMLGKASLMAEAVAS